MNNNWFLGRVVRLLKEDGIDGASVATSRDANGHAFEVDVAGVRYQPTDDENAEQTAERIAKAVRAAASVSRCSAAVRGIAVADCDLSDGHDGYHEHRHEAGGTTRWAD